MTPIDNVRLTNNAENHTETNIGNKNLVPSDDITEHHLEPLPVKAVKKKRSLAQMEADRQVDIMHKAAHGDVNTIKGVMSAAEHTGLEVGDLFQRLMQKLEA